jgi:hypothetical protein
MTPPPETPADLPEAQTQPLAMLAIVAGAISVLVAPCALMDPRISAINHTLLGVAGLLLGALVRAKVAQGRFDPSNLFQARFGMILGGVGVCLGLAWGVWIYLHPLGY